MCKKKKNEEHLSDLIKYETEQSEYEQMYLLMYMHTVAFSC